MQLLNIELKYQVKFNRFKVIFKDLKDRNKNKIKHLFKKLI